jgi:hypothetical protein
VALKKKLEQKDELIKTLKDCDELKHIKKVVAERERLDDIRLMDDYARILDKQELDRANYFKNIADSQKNYMSKIGDSVLKKQEDQRAEEERRMNQYQMEKNKRYINS